MKEKLTLRNVFIWGAAFLGLLIFCLSFAGSARMSFTEGNHSMLYKSTNAIWSCSHINVYDNGSFKVSGDIAGKPFILPILGIVLVLVAAIGAVLISFLLKNEKLAKILLIVAGALSIVGGIFVFFTGESIIRSFVYEMEESLDSLEVYKAQFKSGGGRYGPGALTVILGILAIIAGGLTIVAPFLPEKKLAK